MKNFCDITLINEIYRIKILVIPKFIINRKWVKVNLIANTFSGIVESVKIDLTDSIESITVRGDEVEKSYYIDEQLLSKNYWVTYYLLDINALSEEEIIEDLKNRIENLDNIYSPIVLLKAIQEIENYETEIL